MEKTTRDHLCDCFDGLDDPQFKRFTGKLVDSKLEPRVRRNAVEGKDRGDVASKLIDTYTEQRALDITVDILHAIDQNQLAEELKMSAGAKESASSSLAGGAANTSSRPRGAAFIEDHSDELVERANSVDAILDKLLKQKVINSMQYSEIYNEKTDHKKMRDLLMGPIRAGGDRARSALYDILMDQQKFMMQDLGAV